MAGINMDSDDNYIWGSNHSIEVMSPGQGLANVSRITTQTSENSIQWRDGDEQLPALLSDSDNEVMSPGQALANVSRITTQTSVNLIRGRDGDEQLPALLSDSDSDDDTTWNNLGGYSSGSSDTSDGDYLFNGNLSDASDDSSIADDDDDYGVFEMLSNHFDVFNNFVPAFFGVSLQMLYARIMENITLDEERESPTPQHILDLLPATKVTVAQVASNMSCCICFCDYVLNEDLLKLPCSHIYHRTCILDWLKIKCTCPTCRLDLTTNTGDTNETNELSDFNAANSSSENLVYSMDREHIYDNIDSFSSQHSIDNITDLPAISSSNLSVNNSNNSISTTGNDSRTSQNTQNISNSSTVSNFVTNTAIEGPSNSNTVDEAVQQNISSNVKPTKRLCRETEIW